MHDFALEDDIAGILCRMPLKPGMKLHIPIAAGILVTHASLPVGGPVRGDKAAIHELAKLEKHLGVALSVLRDLSAEASVALSNVPVSLHGFSRSIDSAPFEPPIRALKLGETPLLMTELINQVISAKDNLEAKLVKRPARRRRDLRAYFSAVALLGFYEEFTGKRASVTTDPIKSGHPRRGEFLDLLTEVFRVLAISASPASQAKTALKRDCSLFNLDIEFNDLVATLTAADFRKGYRKEAP
jgi:hypothetical protein